MCLRAIIVVSDTLIFNCSVAKNLGQNTALRLSFSLRMPDALRRPTPMDRSFLKHFGEGMVIAHLH